MFAEHSIEEAQQFLVAIMRYIFETGPLSHIGFLSRPEYIKFLEEEDIKQKFRMSNTALKNFLINALESDKSILLALTILKRMAEKGDNEALKFLKQNVIRIINTDLSSIKTFFEYFRTSSMKTFLEKEGFWLRHFSETELYQVSKPKDSYPKSLCKRSVIFYFFYLSLILMNCLLFVQCLNGEECNINYKKDKFKRYFMKEFKINEFLTLKLEERKTNIYVKGERFKQCKFLMLSIPIKETERFDEIESIDEAADMLGWTAERQLGVEYKINPENEFWGHCSNLQVWNEHEYDTRLLHSNLAFSLLRKLAEVGDPIANRVYKEEIVKRFESGYPSVIAYILEEELLTHLNSEERSYIIEQNLPAILKAIDRLSEDEIYEIYNYLIQEGKKTKKIEDHFLFFTELIGKLPDKKKNRSFSQLINLIKNTEVLKVILEDPDKLSENAIDEIYDKLYKESERTKKLEVNFLFFLKLINKLPDEEKNRKFSELIDSIKNTEVIYRNLSKIETQFLTLLDSTDKLPIHLFFISDFIFLIDSIKGTELFNKHISRIDAQVPYLLNHVPGGFFEMDFHSNFKWLIKKLADYGLLEKNFSIILETIAKLSRYSILTKPKLPRTRMLKALRIVFNQIKNTELLSRFNSKIKAQFETILKNFDKYTDDDKVSALLMLIEVARETGWIKDYFPIFLDFIVELPDNYEYRAFYTLIDAIKDKDSSLMIEFYPQILFQFGALVNSLDKLCDCDYNCDKYHKLDAYFELIDAIEDTELENERVFTKWKEEHPDYRDV